MSLNQIERSECLWVNQKALKKFGLKYPNDDDDEIYTSFNSFLSSLVKIYKLNASDIQKLCKMFLNGATFEQIEQMAIDLYSQHKEQYAEACQRIADEKAGGVGEYHGFIGRNNPKRRQRDDYEMDR